MGIKIPKEILNRIAENPTVANSEIHDAFPRFSEYCGWSGFTETHARLGHDDMTEYVVRDISKEASFSEISEYYKAVYRTGYDKAEMLRIETAFETNTQITVMEHKRWSADEIMQDQYVGLMAVVDVLCEIHGAVEDGSREETKARFIAAA